MLPRQPAWIALAVGSMTIDGVGGAQARLALEQAAQRAVGERQLLAAEEDEADVDVRPVAEPAERELDHHGVRALHVGGAEAVDRVALAPAGAVVLRRDRVEMAGEQDERALAARRRAGEDAGVAGVAGVDPARAQDVEDVRGERRLVARLGGDVDELEGAGGEAVGRGHAPGTATQPVKRAVPCGPTP